MFGIKVLYNLDTTCNLCITPNIPVLNLRLIGPKEILSLIKSSQLSGISTPHLEDALKILNIEFTYLINVCLDQGVPSKIIEHAVYNQLIYYLEIESWTFR